MKLIYIPLAVLFLLGILSMTGLGTSALGNMILSVDPSSAMYYDSGGHGVVFIANMSAVGEEGRIAQVFNPEDFVIHPAGWAAWVNGTLTLGQNYPLYYANGQPVSYDDVGKSTATGMGSEMSLSSSLGFIALVAGLIIMSIAVGIRILGNGVSEMSVSAVIKGTAYVVIWGVFSFMAMALLVMIPTFGAILYFGLTLIYTLGVINQFGSPGDE